LDALMEGALMTSPALDSPAPSPAQQAKLDAYFSQAKAWREELQALRAILRGCPLTETLKWGVPCYMAGGHNIVLIHVFKAYCAVLFHQGALLKDPRGVLIQQTANTQAARQMRFTALAQVTDVASVLKAYVTEAIGLAQAGAKVPMKATADFPVPRELQQQLQAQPALKAAFAALTPGRQRAYLLHFAQAKQASTRLSRMEVCTPRILAGKGLADRD
jgi:uncharacterized protein YdeI (YjbR/CyaY-like superfamily)